MYLDGRGQKITKRMHLYLLRHGKAEQGRIGQPDSARELTTEGQLQIQQQAWAFQRMEVQVELIFSSPYRRARQTADIVGRTLGQSVVEAPQLACGCRLSHVLELFDLYHQPDHALLVGHQPDLGKLIAVLTGGCVAVQPGTLAHLRTDRLRPGNGALIGLYPPDEMARLGLQS